MLDLLGSGCYGAGGADDADGVDGRVRGKLVVRDDRHARERVRDQGSKVAAEARRAEHDGTLSEARDALDLDAERLDELLGAARVEPEIAAVRGLDDRVDDLVLDRRVERDRGDRAVRARRAPR